jgi:hypothetical protein
VHTLAGISTARLPRSDFRRVLDEFRSAGNADLMDASLHSEFPIAQVASPKPEDFRPTQAARGAEREGKAERLGRGARRGQDASELALRRDCQILIVTLGQLDTVGRVVPDRPLLDGEP